MDNQIDLLAAALAELPPEQSTPNATTTNGAKPTTQFTLASMPLFSVYLQGPALSPVALEPIEPADLIPWTAAALASGQLRIRRISYRPVPAKAANDLISTLSNTITSNGLLSREYRALVANLIKEFPILFDSIGGASGLLDKTISLDRALAAISNWQSYAASLPLAANNQSSDSPAIEPLGAINLDSLLGLD